MYIISNTCTSLLCNQTQLLRDSLNRIYAVTGTILILYTIYIRCTTVILLCDLNTVHLCPFVDEYKQLGHEVGPVQRLQHDLVHPAGSKHCHVDWQGVARDACWPGRAATSSTPIIIIIPTI